MFLAKIRSINASLNEKQKIFTGLIWLVLVGIGAAADKWLPFNYLFNTLRALIAIFIGVLLYSFIYLYLVRRANNILAKKEHYTTLRSRFSYKERINISVVMLGAWLLTLIMVTRENVFFTLFSSVLITAAIGILTFLRSSREEDATAKMGLDDARDIKFEKRRQEEIARRKEESTKKDAD